MPYIESMAGKVFKFRTLKWGDPERKLKMLPDEPRRPLPWIEIGLLTFIALPFGVCAWHLL